MGLLRTVAETGRLMNCKLNVCLGIGRDVQQHSYGYWIASFFFKRFSSCNGAE